MHSLILPTTPSPGRKLMAPLEKGQRLRMTEVASYLHVSHQRVSVMYAEGKLPAPDRMDKPTTIERWAERVWWETRRWRKRPKNVR